MDALEFERFLEAYERDVFSFCRYLAGDGHIAADLYQDTALAAFEMMARIDGGGNPRAFLFSLAAGKWKNMRRKAARRQGIAPETPLEETAARAGTGLPEAAAQNALLRECVHRALAGMKDKFRVPMILRYFDDCPLETIAEILSVPAGTVKSRLHKGRALLKAALGKEGFTYG